ncbi:NAD(P)-dependent oxidoreductase [Embleya sp. NPDC001921]
MSDTNIAFIGLGIMGAPMAAHLVRAGYRVIGCDHNPLAVEALVAAGGRGATTITRAVADADVVITMLPDSPDVEAASTGDDGIYAGLSPGTLHIDCSSIRPDVSRALAGIAAPLGIGAVDAPVSGGQDGARDATLSIMVGGATPDVERARPILDVLGATVAHVGGVGAGQTVKAANQLIVAGTIELVAEALVFLKAHDVDVDATVDVLAGGLAGSAVLARKARPMLAHDFTPGFRIDLHHKDMGIVTAAAREAGVIIPLGAHVAQLIASAKAQGDGALDHGALLRTVERLSGAATPTKED